MNYYSLKTIDRVTTLISYEKYMNSWNFISQFNVQKFSNTSVHSHVEIPQMASSRENISMIMKFSWNPNVIAISDSTN